MNKRPDLSILPSLPAVKTHFYWNRGTAIGMVRQSRDIERRPGIRRYQADRKVLGTGTASNRLLTFGILGRRGKHPPIKETPPTITKAMSIANVRKTGREKVCGGFEKDRNTLKKLCPAHLCGTGDMPHCQRDTDIPSRSSADLYTHGPGWLQMGTDLCQKPRLNG